MRKAYWRRKCIPILKWRSKLKLDWESIVGEAIELARPHHSTDEMRRLFAHMHDKRVNPMFGLAFGIGGEQRMGQVTRALRSHLDLPDLPTLTGIDDCEAAQSAGPCGVLRVMGSGKKKASPVVLTREQRATLDGALKGYLSDYEALYRAGSIRDYPLFPAGRFKKGKSKLIVDAAQITRTAALNVLGRGWNGVRRVAADVAENYEKDERVLNAITGHRDIESRWAVFQEVARPEVLRQPAVTRTKARGLDQSMTAP